MLTRNPKVVYSGLVSYREHVDLFVKSMPFIKRDVEGVEFYITDKGENLKKIKKLAKQLSVNPVYFWYPKKGDFVNFLTSCDVAVLPSSNDLARQMGTPVKLFDYMSAVLPVVANDSGGWTKMIETEKIGLLTEDNPESFAQGILKLLNDQTLSRRFTRNGLELIKEKMNWDSSVKLLVQSYEDLLRV
jgi:glycosyltransferase involved in cell wall biosynthesis